ncbi:histidine kinase dimerisation and phosphoacceptor region [Beutenbergia cavernae DSM 12333]|uniref:histidine kinase n=1 Tax=Beutenbergia cavernae (strain ATCC BAA-8 / DSM 12333 / CCUG 43141 / JCM 11478 / NBRC 16432 / NCIMB 13614 / HKI 0122) TaxID=471853 RepID=C5BVR0_BEUC1|nr:histidine kinase [Beutenbergia cavernae]ACQ78500.1 histidine kinase dimerisation and phosphoacceptor region [Beutenbergia cavernae DSM 12333]
MPDPDLARPAPPSSGGDGGTGARASVVVRAGVYLVLGGVVAAAYAVLGVGLWQLVDAAPQVPLPMTVAIAVVAVPLGALPPFLAPIRELETAAARSLLGAGVDDVPAPPGGQLRPDDRARAAAFFGAHLILGGAILVGLLAGLPTAVGLLGAALGVPSDGIQLVPGESTAAALGPWAIPVALAILVALPLGTALAGSIMRALAPPLLGPGPEQRAAAERARIAALAERNRLARELHDSVGHALTVTTLQATAAERLLSRDPDAVREALRAIQDTGRSALADLDHALGLLRSDDAAARPARAPDRTLDDLPRLVAESAAAGHTLGVDGDVPPGLPGVVSREAYAIVAEAAVNAWRHGSGPARVRLDASDSVLGLEIANPVPTTSGAGRADRAGRGVVGMRERAHVVGGTLEAGASDAPDGATWVVRARLPWRRADD